MSSGAHLVTEDELLVAEAQLKLKQIEWKKRRRAATDVMNQVCDSMNMSSKMFEEKVGIDTDEEFGVTCQ